jgi:hypothetical protein
MIMHMIFRQANVFNGLGMRTVDKFDKPIDPDPTHGTSSQLHDQGEPDASAVRLASISDTDLTHPGRVPPGLLLARHHFEINSTLMPES